MKAWKERDKQVKVHPGVPHAALCALHMTLKQVLHFVAGADAWFHEALVPAPGNSFQIGACILRIDVASRSLPVAEAE